MMLQGYKFKTCYDFIKLIIHLLSTEVECVAPLCLSNQLPPPCGVHIMLTVGVVHCLPDLMLVVVDEDVVIALGVRLRDEAEGDSPHTSHRNFEHSSKHLS